MPTYSPTKLGQVYIRRQSNFATPYSAADAASGLAVEAAAFVPTATREVFQREAVTGDYHKLGAISGSQAGQNTITLTMPMHGISATTPVSNLTNHAEAEILASILGGNERANYNASKVVQASSDADTIKAGSSPEWQAGQGVIIQTTSGASGYEMGFIEDASDATSIELRTPLGDATPEDGSTAYGTANAWLSTVAPEAYTILVRGLDNNTQILAKSCVPTSVTITLDPKGVPTMEATFWVNEIAQSAAGSALSNYAYSLPVLPVATANDACRLVYGNASATAFDVESFTLSIEQTIQPQLGHGASSGVRDVIVTDRTVSASFTSLVGAATPWDTSANMATVFDLNDVDDGTGSKCIQLTLGNTPGQMFGFSIPQPLNVSPPALTDSNGMWAVSHEITVGKYASDTGPVLSVDKPIVIAFG